MRSVILAIDQCSGEDAHRMAPPFLLPLVDRPFIQHVVERMIDIGVTTFDIVLDKRTRAIQAHFGSGERWGCAIHYHYAQEGRYPFACLRTLENVVPDEPILLITADALPELTRNDFAHLVDMAHTLYYSNRQTRPARHWSGWALIDGCFLSALPTNINMETLSMILRQAGEICLGDSLLHACSYADLLKAQQSTIAEKISKRARVHPTATIIGQVYIGDNVQIKRGARIGPNVAVGAGSVIGADTTIQNSLVCPKTYIGDGLEINQMILDGTELFHAALSAAVTIQEPVFLSRLSR